MQAITTVSVSDKQKGCRFDIMVGEDGSKTDNYRVFSLLADTEQECDTWVKKIKDLVARFENNTAADLSIDTRGKFWKNTVEIREARSRPSQNWGDRRYLLEEAPDDSKDVSTMNSGSYDPEESSVVPDSSAHLGEVKKEEYCPFDFKAKLTDDEQLGEVCQNLCFPSLKFDVVVVVVVVVWCGFLS